MTKEEQQAWRDKMQKTYTSLLDRTLTELDQLRNTELGGQRCMGLLQVIGECYWKLELNTDYDVAPTEEPGIMIEPATTIEDVVAAETEAILGKTETAVEEPTSAPTYTKQEVINILTGLNKKHGEDAKIIPSALARFGCSKLSEMPEEKYGELVVTAKEIAGES